MKKREIYMKQGFALCLCILLATVPFFVSAETSPVAAKPRIAVYGMVNLIEDESWNGPTETATANLMTLFRMLGSYEVVPAAGLPRNLTDAGLTAWCRGNGADYFVYGMALPSGKKSQAYTLTLFDGGKGTTAFMKSERGQSIQDLYVACDRLSVAAAESLVGHKIAFGMIEFANEGEKGDFVAWIDGERMKDNPDFLSRIVAGRHNVKVTRPVGDAEVLVKETGLEVVEGKTARFTFELKPIDKAALAQAAQTAISGYARIKKGNFLMGSNVINVTLVYEGTRVFITSPQHLVVLSEYVLGTTEVTQEQYESVIGANPSRFKGANLPVEGVTWVEACIYCNRLSMREGYSPAYVIIGNDVSWDETADGYRLPTDAEWEYACRIGDQKNPVYNYNCLGKFTLNPEEKNKKKRIKTAPVGTYGANGFGLYDMHGNVSEWCWDRFGAYSGAKETDPTGPSVGNSRVQRGGDWTSDEFWCGECLRNPVLPSGTGGFRVARSIFPREAKR